MSKKLPARPRKTSQEIMSESVKRDQALRELERALGKPQVKRYTLAEYQAMIEAEREEKRGGWWEGDSSHENA